MRTHGWQGDPPRTDEEARDRILEATGRCIDRYGVRKTSLTDVAEELGVTRATVYRYFRNIEDLLRATSIAAAGEFLDRLTGHVSRFGDPAEILVEAMAFTIERLPAERRVGLLMKSGRTVSLNADLFSPVTMDFSVHLLKGLPIDWATCGYSDTDLQDLTEYMLRLLHSFLPLGADGGRQEDPRPFLRRWFVPAFAAPLSR